MNPGESVRVALRALGANKLRAGLTMLGMIIGVGAVIALMSIGQGVQASVTSQIKGLGSNLLFVTPGATTSGGVRAQAGTAPTLTSEDAEAIVDSGRVPQAVAAAPEAGNFGQVVANGQNTFTRLNGVTPDYLGVRNFAVAEGEFISPEQITTRSLVAVLGATARQNLFADSDALGQTVRVNNVNLRVVGVMEAKGAQAQGNQDDVIYVPLSTMQTRLNRNRTARGGQTVSTINVQLADDRAETRIAAVQNIGELLRERHRTAEDDFTIRSQEDLLQTANQITGFITIFLGAVAGISLLVGGIGIMNIMLVSVTERTREIGIRKAIGARRQDILWQFLIEATMVSLVGGAIGILIGAGGSRLLNGIRFGGPQAQPIQTVVSPDAVLLAFTVSALIGLFFGVYPAVKASRLNPIEALRYE
ncbi:MAG TPA: ABC transporter permease [Chloroflexota bacterium]|jgi:putative ABC transport system permease protein|nr:ABC transporter permease [Chloroflexota bacterium]HEX2516444.1 ABC transporter permease [Chloroflexota bacterium]